MASPRGGTDCHHTPVCDRRREPPVVGMRCGPNGGLCVNNLARKGTTNDPDRLTFVRWVGYHSGIRAMAGNNAI